MFVLEALLQLLSIISYLKLQQVQRMEQEELSPNLMEQFIKAQFQFLAQELRHTRFLNINMSNVAQIDQNDKPTWLAYNETTGLVETVYVDPVLDAVLVYAVANDGSAFTAINRAKIDGNDNPTQLGYNETTGLVEALRCNSSGYLLITNAT